MRIWVVLMLGAVSLAGCSEAEGDDPGGLDEENDDEALTTGVLRGVVVDTAIRPLADAIVSIRQNGSVVIEVATDPDGNFGVPNLDAGDYAVNVSKPGFLPSEVPGTVVGGENLPDLIQILLEPAPVDAAFVMPFVWSGQVGCGTTLQNWCAAVKFVTGIEVAEDESFRFLFDEFMAVQRTPDFLQVEVVWEPNNDLSRWAYGAFWASTWEEWEECLCTPNILGVTTGETYILTQVNRTIMEEYDVGFSTGVGVGFSAGEGIGAYQDLLAHPDRLTVMVNQPFEAFMHAFYGCIPDPDWRFTTHGEPECDPQSVKGQQ